MGFGAVRMGFERLSGSEYRGFKGVGIWGSGFRMHFVFQGLCLLVPQIFSHFRTLEPLLCPLTMHQFFFGGFLLSGKGAFLLKTPDAKL